MTTPERSTGSESPGRDKQVVSTDQMGEKGALPAAEKLAPDTAVEVHLDLRTQNRNALVFAAQVALIFLAAPVLYVGFVQGALCKRLHTSDTIANLASSVYLAMAWFPVLAVWLIPQVRLLKRSISAAFATSAIIGGVVALVLLVDGPAWLVIGALVVHAGVVGSANGVINTFNWEALGRGVSEKGRGKALALAMGVGPVFAIIGSLASQLILKGEAFGWKPPGWPEVPYPYNFALLFGASVPILLLASRLAAQYRIPLPEIEVEREPLGTAILGGFKQLFTNRLLLIACVAYLLMYSGHMIQNNISLYTKDVLGRPVADFVGYQNMLRFSFKMLAGFFLGWLLTRTNPKVPMLVTAGLDIISVLWALFAPGYWFLLAFGINGAGELFGAYYFVYPLACSPKSQMRRNMALLSLISVPVGFAPLFYGWISDTWNLRASMWVALGVMVFTAALVAKMLPSRPRPRAQDLLAADLAEEKLK
ncbi:MAG: MFS transporter [Opitutaceae bacterium]|nr:MFS transporter [Opitutaceae bacterium]